MVLTYPFPRRGDRRGPGRLHQPADHRRPRPAHDPRQPQRRAASPGLPTCLPVLTGLPTGLPGLPPGCRPACRPAVCRCRRCPPAADAATGADARLDGAAAADAAWSAGIRVGPLRRTATGAPTTLNLAAADDGGLGMIRRSAKLQLVAFAADHAASGVSYVSARYVGLGDSTVRRRLRRHRRLRRVRRHLRERRGDLPRRGGRPGRPAAAGRRRRARRPAPRRRHARSPRTPSPSWRTARRWGSSTSTCSRAAAAGRSSPTAAASPRGQHGHARCTPRRCCCNLDRLVNSVDKRDLAVVIDELGTAFAGSGRDLQRLHRLRRRPDQGGHRRAARDASG